MNAPSLNSLRNGLADNEQSDERMDQIRELLVGDMVRESQTRLNALEGRVNELERAVSQQLDAIHARIEALSGEVGGQQRAAFDELANSVRELGDRISRIPRSS